MQPNRREVFSVVNYTIAFDEILAFERVGFALNSLSKNR